MVEAVGDLCFTKLTNDPEELLRFMNVAGYNGAALRRALGTPALTRGMIEYVAQNEPLMLAVCGEGGIKPEAFMRVYYQLNPGG
jgi:hypothetical protein